MKALDRELQRQRIQRALPFIRPGSSVVDVGCHEGAFFEAAQDRVSSGVGIDIRKPERWIGAPCELHVGRLPELVEGGRTFDAIVALAVVEHVPPRELEAWGEAVPALLRPGGRFIVTTPSPRVDRLLDLLIRLRLLDGMDADAHHGFDPREVPRVFENGLMHIEVSSRFQLGLNHLFVFRRA
ncbi:MAG: class I SAM-dependent methyltransferase [Acidimicrobiales bacterium]